MTTPHDIVLDYLQCMEARDLTAARGHLADSFEMQFPGAPRMTKLEDLMAWAAQRYRAVAKTRSSIETLQNGFGIVVYVRGTLSGTWPSGEKFEGIRFIDRFEVAKGKITRLDVWNDLGEMRAR